MAKHDARKLTPDVRRAILAALSIGSYRAGAARIAGITPTTLYRWLEHGENAKPRSKLAQFYKEVCEAEERPKAYAMRAIMESIRGDPANNKPGNPKIALDFLRRRYPAEFGGSERIQIDAVHHITGAPQDAPESLSDMGLTDDQIQLLGTQLARLESGQVPVPALTNQGDTVEDWTDGEEGVDWEWEYVVEDDGEEG